MLRARISSLTRNVKVSLWFSFLVTISAVGLKLFYPQILQVMETKQTTNRSENSGILDYGVDGGPVIGIDLGVAYSRVGIVRGENFEIIPDLQGKTKTPSCVSFLGDLVLVGDEAQALTTLNAQNTIHNIRDLVGRKSDSTTFSRYARDSPLQFVEQDGMFALQLQINGKSKVLPAHEILAHLIRKLKRDAESYLDGPVQYAIATVPAYFDDLQREFVKNAALHAGLKIIRLVNEPMASGIANRIEADSYTSDEGKILFVDVNDASFDVTIALVEEGIYEIVASTSTSIEGDKSVSGMELDSVLLDYVASMYVEERGKDIVNDRGAMGRLRLEVGLAERKLLSNESATFTIQPRWDSAVYTIDILSTEYHGLIDKIFQTLVSTLMKALNDAKLQPEEIDALVITGDPSRVARVKPLLLKEFDGKPVIELVPSDEAFVRGAAQVGRVFTEPLGDIICCLDISPLGLGIEVEGGLFHKLILRSSIIPTRKSIIVTTQSSSQSKVVLRIFEGERLFTKDNKLLGVIEMDGIALVENGELELEITFDIDADRKLKVVLMERSTSREAIFTDDKGMQIDYDEVEKAVIEAEENFETDEVARLMLSSKPSKESVDSFGVKLPDR